MKIKLILAAAKSDPLRKNDPFMPLSLAILAGAAPEHDYIYCDMLWEDNLGFDEKVDLAGISSRYTAENTTYEIAAEFKKRGIPVVLGGPQMSSVPHRAKKHADAVVVGEAENLWPVLLKDFQEKKLKNFYVCSPYKFDARGSTVYQDFLYPDFKKNILPKRSLFKKKYNFDTLFAVRGCPIDCDFCSVSSIFGKQYRFKPVDHVIEELKSLKSRYYYLLDDTVLGRPSSYDYYLELYTRIAGEIRPVKFWTGQANLNAAADEKGREVIHRAVNAGLLYAAVGIESINPQTLLQSGSIKKMGINTADHPLEKIQENIRFMQNLGIIVSGWFVIGYTEDTIETYKDTWEFCKNMNILPVIFPVKAMEGTRLYNRLLGEGMIDLSARINVINPKIPSAMVFPVLKKIIKEAYSLIAIIKRTVFYARIYRKQSPREFIEKTIFAFILQIKLRHGIDLSKDDFYS
ncbi:MAG: hypothetical protein A2096_12410 [Spirochaetes bacterium GWF1_41_5]|nr:MAG: hypothetical protein A2096_12410 [Spirochaetes bacterium GWF1_41_5]